MRLAMVGLGRMGANMTRRLLDGGHEVVVFDIDEAAVAASVEGGALGSASLAELGAQLEAPRVVWVMVPSGPITDSTIEELADVLEPGDLIIDGGNSRYTHSAQRAAALAERELAFIDCGTSGGIWGLEEGYNLMAGGTPEAIALAMPVFETLAPAGGFAHVGPAGAGHFVKMVHNGIEYGLMQAYGEGFELLQRSEFGLDVGQIAELWRHGSVVRSWLLDLVARALTSDPDLSELSDVVADSGEGRWTIEAAIQAGVPVPAIASALFHRFGSQQDASFAGKVISALRHEFGGHPVGKPKP
ncbi:MAG TPA: decarboxylating 6-phosphogluconate dehydrogenase [Actinomycetota bacterium]|nr:decarboxylating 6-phosphogluconate dehydrogenase [Actinomycetota bacterium]